MWRLRPWPGRGTAGPAGLMAGLAAALLGGMLTSPAAGATGHGAPGRAPAARTAAVRTLARAAAPAADPPSLSMTSSVSPNPLVIGGSAVYTVTVQNTGNADAASVTTTLPFTPAGSLTIGTLPSGCGVTGSQIVTCTATPLAASDSVTYQIPVTVLPGLSDGTNIALRGTATAAGAAAASTQLIAQAYTQTDVEIDKTGPATVSAGGTITYAITVINHGPSNAVQVYWHDPTDGNLTSFVSVSPSTSCDTGGLTITCSLQSMTPGQTQTYQMQLRANAGLADGTKIPNCVYVYTGTRQSNTDNDTSCMSTTVGTGRGPTSQVTISKSAAQSTVEVGGTIGYSVTVTNNGPDPATNVTVSDPLNVPFVSVSALPADCALQDTTVTCTAASLGVSESRTYSFSVALDPRVAAGTNVSNCASATSTTNVIVQQPTPSCVQTTVVPVPLAQLAIAKSGPATAGAGNTFSYTLTASNSGPDAAADVAVSDSVDTSVASIVSVPDGCTVTGGTVTCVVGTLAANDSRDFTITIQASAGDGPGTDIHDCGTVASSTADPSPGDTSQCVDTYIDPPVPVAQVVVTKAGPTTARAGDPVSYTLSATNQGPDDATDVVVKDPLNASQVTAASLPDGCALGDSTVICDAGPLAVGDTKTFTITVTAASGLPAGTTIDNCGQASSVSTLLPPGPQPACVETTIVPSPSADVSAGKSGPPAAAPGGTISYTLTAANHGPDDAAGVTVTDVLNPALVTLVTPLPAGCAAAAGTVTCQAGTVAAGASRDFAIDVRVNPGIQGVVIPNCAQAYTTTQDPDLSNNQSCLNTAVNVPAPTSAVIDVAKHAPAFANADGTATFTIDVTNTGPGAADNVILTDPLDVPLVSAVSVPNECVVDAGTLTCLPGDLAVGQTKTLSYTVRIAAHAATGAQLSNCVTAGSEVTELREGTAPACTQTVIVPAQVAHLRITKTALSQVQPGGTITYRVTLTNSGPDAAQDVVVHDPVHDPSLVTISSMPPECALAGRTVTCSLATLPAGVTREFTATIRVGDDVPGNTVLGNCISVYSPTEAGDVGLRNHQSCVNTVVRGPAVRKHPFVPVTG